MTRHHSPECVQGGAKFFTAKWDERRSCRGALFCLLFLCSALLASMPMGSYGEAVMIPLFCCLVQPVKMGAQTPFLRDFGRHKRLHRRPFCVTSGRPSGCILHDFGAEENR